MGHNAPAGKKLTFQKAKRITLAIDEAEEVAGGLVDALIKQSTG